ncbi:MAG: hypothetical protein PHX61_02475 [Alphaproteobacteria bacterium]|nr:hypothetical protein [Alphaproteobacteria bacterium]
MKLTLAEFDAFQKSLSKEWYFEDDGLPDEFWEGHFNPAEVVTINKGDVTISYQGENEQDLFEDEKHKDFFTEFRKWKTGIDFEIVAVRIPKGKKEELLKLVKEVFGGKGDERV